MSRGCEPNVKEQDNNFGHRSRGGKKVPIRLFSLTGPSRVVPTGIELPPAAPPVPPLQATPPGVRSARTSRNLVAAINA